MEDAFPLTYFYIEEEPNVFLFRLSDIPQQVDQARHRLRGSAQCPQCAQVPPIMIGNPRLVAKAALQRSILDDGKEIEVSMPR